MLESSRTRKETRDIFHQRESGKVVLYAKKLSVCGVDLGQMNPSRKSERGDGDSKRITLLARRSRGVARKLRRTRTSIEKGDGYLK